MIEIRKAERKRAKLRVGLFGPSGSGKTMSALKMARGIAPWEKIVVIDTENKSADLYSHLGGYSVITMAAPFTPESYIAAIQACEDAGFEVIILDSITHEWAGAGGILELADQLGKDSKSSFTVWSKLTPRHNKFIERILASKCHVICCGRSKQDYALNQTEKNGKMVNVPEKIGLKAITREGFDYEMTISFDLMISHYAISTKDRTGLFQDKPEEILNEEAGKLLIDWANGGALDPDVELATEQQTDSIYKILEELKPDMAVVNDYLLKTFGADEVTKLTQSKAIKVLELFTARLEDKRAKDEERRKLDEQLSAKANPLDQRVPESPAAKRMMDAIKEGKEEAKKL